MKSLFLTVFLLIATTAIVFAQTSLPTLNILHSDNYSIKAEVQDLHSYKYTISKNDESSMTKSFLLMPNTEQAFKKSFTKYFKLVATTDTNQFADAGKIDSILAKEAERLFYTYTVSEITYGSVLMAPTAGKIYFRDSVEIERKPYKNRDFYKKFKHFKREVRNVNSDEIKRYNSLIKTSAQDTSKIKTLKAEHDSLQKTYTSKQELKSNRKNETRKTWIKDMEQALIDRLTLEEQHKVDSVRNVIYAYQKNILSKFLDSLDKDKRYLEIIRNKIESLNNKKILSQKLHDSIIDSYKQKYPKNPVILNIDNLSQNDDSLKIGIIKWELSIQPYIDSLQKNNKGKSKTDSLNIVARIIHLKDSIAEVSASIYSLSAQIKEILTSNTKLIDSVKLYSDNIPTIQIKILQDQAYLKPYRNYMDRTIKNYHKLRRELIQHSFNITELEIEFNDGFIENIVVMGMLQDDRKDFIDSLDAGEFLKFNNQYPIGFSRKWDYWKYKDSYILYAKGSDGGVYTMDVRSVISDYIEKLEVDRRDYSPQDTVVSFKFDNHPEKSMTLYKEDTYKLFEAKIYSDFVGLSDQNPNGLVQTEISRKINLVTYRFVWFQRRNINMKVTFGGYIKPEIVLSKIEKNNKSLLLEYKDRVIDNQYVPLKYTSTLKLRQYENFNAGFDVNLITMDIPSFKSLFYFDAGFRYGRTSITDSVRNYQNNQIVHTQVANNFGVNTARFYPKITWEIKSDERYCFNFSYGHVWYYLRDNSFTQVGNLESYNSNGQEGIHNKQYNQVTLLAMFNPNRSSPSKGKLFFRYQFFWQQDYFNTTFQQAQVGYSFFLLSHNN